MDEGTEEANKIITVDDREVSEAQKHRDIYIPDELAVPCIVERLDAADYAFNDRGGNPTGIERSEIGNLLQKLRTGELEEQLLKCQDNYEHIILLIEGVYDQYGKMLAIHKAGDRGYFRVHIYPRTQYEFIKALEVRLSEIGIEILSSANFDCSMSVVRTIYHQRTKPEEDHALFKKTRAVQIPTRLTNNPSVPRLMALCPRLSEKAAIRLVNKYGTIWAILNTDDKELLEIEGFGKGLLDKLKKGVGKAD